MRSTNQACVLGLVVAFAASCGDNSDGPGLSVKTHVAKQTVAAGERIGARCEVLDPEGMPALDKDGQPLINTVELAIAYQLEDSFSKDADGEVIAARAGEATVRCSVPELGLIDRQPVKLEIVAGPPTRVITQLASATTPAGEPVSVTCLAFDAFNNPVEKFEQALALSPFGAGAEATARTVSATIAGSYEVSCAVAGASDVADDFLEVVPALPSSVIANVQPERSLYQKDDQVTLVAEAHDRFGNRVDDVVFDYTSDAEVAPKPDPEFQFSQDGIHTLTATVKPPTFEGTPLTASRSVVVDSGGPAIQCMRADAPSQASEAYMMQAGPSTIVLPVRVSAAFPVQSVTINGAPATLNPATGNYEVATAASFGMNFADVVARDQLGKENSTTCFVLIADTFTPENTTMPGALGMRLDPAAIGDPVPTGLNSINDILHTILGSDQLRSLVNGGLVAANPINDGGICEPDVSYNSGSIHWDQPASTLTLVPGGLRAQVTLPNVALTVRASGTICCIGGSTIKVKASSISATVTFSLQLQGGVLRVALAGAPTVSVGTVSLDGSGFCGFIIDLLQGFFTGTVASAVKSALNTFITTNVTPLLDQLVRSLDISTLGTSFSVPRLDGSGSINLGFGLAFSSFNITSARALLGIGTRFTPAVPAQNRPSLGVPRRITGPLLDPPGTSSARPVGLSLYEGVLNQVLHGLWRGGFFQAQVQLGTGTATLDARLPPVAAINGGQAQLMLGGIQATIQIPGIIDQPLPILFGGRATASVALVGDALHFGNLALAQVFVSVPTPLSQAQRTALENFLLQVLQGVLVDAINDG
ncbi:MAG TPA: hypothetical protein VFK02_05940, partial [Kofleriaceae bacterium]|nr:hypothetical protein [Kofleriaceae bacterium]